LLVVETQPQLAFSRGFTVIEATYAEGFVCLSPCSPSGFFRSLDLGEEETERRKEGDKRREEKVIGIYVEPILFSVKFIPSRIVSFLFSPFLLSSSALREWLSRFY